MYLATPLVVLLLFPEYRKGKYSERGEKDMRGGEEVVRVDWTGTNEEGIRNKLKMAGILKILIQKYRMFNK